MRLAILLGAAFLPAAALAQVQPALPIGPESTLLNISAEGQSRRAPDLASFSAGVVTNGATAAEALSANARQMETTIAALKRAGVADRDIQTAAISLQPRYSDPNRDAALRARQTGQPYSAVEEAPRIIGYEARNSVQVRVRRLGEMGRIIDALVQAGANQIDGPSFTLEEPAQALDEARREAVANGRARAELYARAAGLRVGRILSISEGGGYYPVQPIMVTGRAAGFGAPPPPPPPPSPVQPGELSLGITLNMQFELVK